MLKMTVDTLDTIAPANQGLYSQGDDGKFHLQVEGSQQEQTAPPAAQQTPAPAPAPKVVEVIPESVKAQLAEYQDWKAQQEQAQNEDLKKKGNYEEFIKRLIGRNVSEGTGTAWFFNTLQNAKREKVRLHDYWMQGILIKVYNSYLAGDPPVRYFKFDVDEGLPEVV